MNYARIVVGRVPSVRTGCVGSTEGSVTDVGGPYAGSVLAECVSSARTVAIFARQASVTSVGDVVKNLFVTSVQ